MKELYLDVKSIRYYLHIISVKEDKPWIVFLHDSLGCVETWRDFPNKTSEVTDCNVLVYDRQGYGKSQSLESADRTNDYMEKEAFVLLDILDELKIERPILFGHSDGGTIALIAAAKYPEKIKAIITEGAHVFVEDITLQGIKEAMNAYEKQDLKKRLSKYHGKNTEIVFRAWTGIWLSDAFRNWNIEHFLPGVLCRNLIIQSESDEFGTLRQVESITSKTTGSSVKLIVSNASHTPHRDAEETVLHACREFIIKYNN